MVEEIQQPAENEEQEKAGGVGGALLAPRKREEENKTALPEIPFKTMRDRVVEEAKQKGLKSKEEVEELVKAMYPDYKYSFFLVGNVMRICGISKAIKQEKEIREQEELERRVAEEKDDVQIFVESLRQEIQRDPSNSALAKLYFEIISAKKEQEDISPELRAKVIAVYEETIKVNSALFCEKCRPIYMSIMERLINRNREKETPKSATS